MLFRRATLDFLGRVVATTRLIVRLPLGWANLMQIEKFFKLTNVVSDPRNNAAPSGLVSQGSAILQ